MEVGRAGEIIDVRFKGKWTDMTYKMRWLYKTSEGALWFMPPSY